MFGFGRPASSSDPVFVVGSSSIFSKMRLSPHEFGREITRIGFKFGVAQFEQYRTATNLTVEDVNLLREVDRNPGIMQLLLTNLITGAFLCYAKVVLRIPEHVVIAVESGVFAELKSTMPGMNEQIVENHKNITSNFAISIEREVRQVEVNSSLSLLSQYMNDLYPTVRRTSGLEMPSGLFGCLTGLGSRFMAVCQNDFRLSLQEGA